MKVKAETALKEAVAKTLAEHKWLGNTKTEKLVVIWINQGDRVIQNKKVPKIETSSLRKIRRRILVTAAQDK